MTVEEPQLADRPVTDAARANAMPLSDSAWLVVRDIFIAPTRAFAAIAEDVGWGLPLFLISAAVYVYLFSIQHVVGWDTVATNITAHRSGAVLDDASPDQLQRVHYVTMAIVKATMYAYPLIILAFNAIAALVLSATINVATEGEIEFDSALAVWTYAMLPRALTPLIGSMSLFLSNNTDDFYLNNAVGTNLAYYLPADSARWLLALGSAIDVFDLWSLALAAIGLSIVAETRRSVGFAVVFGWFALAIGGKMLYVSLV